MLRRHKPCREYRRRAARTLSARQRQRRPPAPASGDARKGCSGVPQAPLLRLGGHPQLRLPRARSPQFVIRGLGLGTSLNPGPDPEVLPSLP